MGLRVISLRETANGPLATIGRGRAL